MTNSQPTQTVLSRRWALQVNTNTVASPTWTTVNGMNNFKPKPHEAVTKDDNAYEDGGWQSKTKTALSWGAEAKLLRRVSTSDDTVFDTGQEKLRALARLLGSTGVAHIRYYDREGGTEAFQGFAEVKWAEEGGGQDDLAMVTVTLEGKGELEIITNPSATPVAVPTISSLTPAAGAAAGGTLVIIRGEHFTGATAIGATGVKFGATNATSFSVLDDGTIAAVAPAKTAATYDVTVTNSTGTSATAGTANDYVYT